MTTAADAIRDVLTPLLPGWVIQFGRWEDTSRNVRHCVIRPAGGAGGDLVRRPLFTVTHIGADGEGSGPASTAAEASVQAMRATSGALVFLQPAEPAFLASNDGRAIFETAVSAITNET
jgi:hypothetical protein